jgi:hypothetical protein
MPTPTYTPLATVTLGSSASSLSFASIPASYRDLILVGDFTGSTIALVKLYLNNDTTASNYSLVSMSGTSGGTGSGTAADSWFGAIYGSNKQTTISQIMDYSATDKHTTILTRTGNAAQSEVAAYAARWANTAAVTSVLLSPASGTFSTGSTFNLFGVIS